MRLRDQRLLIVRNLFCVLADVRAKNIEVENCSIPIAAP